MRKRSYSARPWIVSILLLVLASCWIPETFDTKIAINKDGTYLTLSIRCRIDTGGDRQTESLVKVTTQRS
jgi:hypothetical protein